MSDAGSKASTPRQRGLGGRPLDASRDHALRSAALELLAEIGYDRLTMDAVAERAHAGKGTIYRRWRTKAEFIVAALRCAEPPLGDIDTGSLRGDLIVLAARVTGDSEVDMQVMGGLISALPRDEELRTVFREQLIAPRMASLHAIFDRAVGRGEIPALHNPDLIVSLFPALMVHQILLFGAVPDVAFARIVLDDVLLPLLTGSPGSFRLNEGTNVD